MKTILIGSIIILLAACKSRVENTPAPEADPANAVVAQENWRMTELEETEKPPVPEKQTTAPRTVRNTSSQPAAQPAVTTTENNSGETGSTAAGEGETAEEKKGWSKTAKGAVIGGAVGAATGAVVNKKNRAAGAIIGGVVGAGTGAVIGSQMDKKDAKTE